jgi:SAM-dependent methyltransferase
MVRGSDMKKYAILAGGLIAGGFHAAFAASALHLFKNSSNHLAIAMALMAVLSLLVALSHKFRLSGGPMKESVMQGNAHRTYLPAAGRDWLLPLYDVMTKLMGADRARAVLVEQAQVRPGQRVLDLGCGTGSMTILLKRRYPEVDAVGLDPDPKALAQASRKAARAAVAIRLDRGFGDELPYPEASFDRVLSSLMFHHIPTDEKGKTLRAVRRVLKPGGEFHMLDFEGQENSPHFLARLLHSSQRLKDNSESRVLGLMTEAGFAHPIKVGRRAMPFGHIAYYRATA